METTNKVVLNPEQIEDFKAALKAKAAAKAAEKEAAAPKATKAAKAAAVPAPKATPKAAKKAAAPKAVSNEKAGQVAETTGSKYVEESPEHYFVARDIRGRILPLVTEDGKVWRAVPADMKDKLVSKVQYGPVFRTAGLFITVHRNTSTEGERRMTILRNQWLASRKKSSGNVADWSQAYPLDVPKEKVDKVYSALV